jgi:tetratricopeptide (TPR) repeat protein
MFFLKVITAIAVIVVGGCQNVLKEPLLTPQPTVSQANTVPSHIPYQTTSPLSSDILLQILTAETALQRKKYRVALDLYTKVIEVVDDIAIIKKAARIALHLEDLPKTAQIIQMWLKKDSGNIIARRVALTLALNNKDEATSLEHLDVILKRHPTDFNELVLDIQKVLRSKQDVAFADTLLSTLEKKYPKQATILLSQSILALRQKNLKKAHQKITHALKIQPKWEKALRLREELWVFSANQALDEKKFNQAILFFKKIKHPKLKYKAAAGIIYTLFEQKKIKQANKRVQALFKAYPKKRKDIFLMQAEIHNKQQNYQQAFNILTKLLKESPLEEDILYTRSLIADKLGDLKTTESDLIKILKQNPKNVIALNALGYTLAQKTTRYSEAEVYLNQALAITPNAGSIIDSYGWLKFKQGDLQGALKHLKNARSKLKNTSAENETIAHIAEVLWAMNKKNEARQLINESILKRPKNKYLLDVKTRILDKETP